MLAGGIRTQPSRTLGAQSRAHALDAAVIQSNRHADALLRNPTMRLS
jgi:hypothetical protein